MRKVILFLYCFFIISLALKAQPVCNVNGNLLIYSNYDGGVLNIDVDVNIPNIKIGVCTYEPVTINISGTYAGNVTAVRYAGYVSTNNHHCANSPTTTTITGVSPGITSINFLPASTLSNPNGYSSIVCNYSCNTSSNQGGCNTADQIADYFQSTMSASMRYHYTQYGCWSANSYLMSAGGNCCAGAVSCNLTANAGTDTTICAGGTASLVGSSSSPGTASWSPIAGIGNPGSLTTTASPFVTTNYVLTVTSGNCTATDTVRVIVANTAANAGPDTTICAGASASLHGSGSGTVSWSPSGTVSNPASLNTSASPAGTTSYVLSLTMGGCTVSDTVLVTVQNVSCGAYADTICSNGTLTIVGPGTCMVDSAWGTYVSNFVFAPPPGSSGAHWVHFRRHQIGGACFQTDSQSIYVRIPVSSALASDTVCLGDPAFSLSGMGTPSNGTWSGTGVSNNQFNPAVSGAGSFTLSLAGTDPVSGCSDTASMVMHVMGVTTPSITAIPPDSLSASVSGDDYIWLYNGVAMAQHTHTILAANAGTYQLIVLVGGCPSDTSDAYVMTARFGDHSASLRVYPNPGNGDFSLDAAALNEPFSAEVFNAEGRRVAKFDYPAGANHLRMPLQQQAAGIYSVRILSKETSATLKIEITR